MTLLGSGADTPWIGLGMIFKAAGYADGLSYLPLS